MTEKPAKIKRKLFGAVVRPRISSRYMGSEEGTANDKGGHRNANATMAVRSCIALKDT